MKKLILIVIFFTAIIFKFVLFTNNTEFSPKTDKYLFRTESAVRYHYAKLVSEGKSIPALDQNAQYPEGLRVHDRIKLTTELVAGTIYNFIPHDIPFHMFLIYFMFTVSCITVFTVYMASFKISGNFWGSAASALFLLTAFPYWGRTVSGGFVEEDFALPFIFLGLYFFLKAFEKTPKKTLNSILAGFFMFIPLTSWHLTQFFFLVFLLFFAVMLFLRWEEKDELMLPFFFVSGFNLVGSLVVPTLRAESFILSFGMLFSYALILAWLINRKTGYGKTVFSLSILAFFVLFAFFGSRIHSSEYNHVYQLVINKVKYFGAKPDDPTSMPFDAKVFWQAGFLSPSLPNIITGFLGALLASAFGIFTVVKKVIKRESSIYEEGLLFFLLAFIPLYLLFERLYVFLIFFIIPFIAYVFNIEYKDKRIKYAVFGLLAAAFAFQTYKGVTTDIKQKDVSDHNDMAEWIANNTKEDSPVLANFGVSAIIFAYAERPVLLHPMFESADIRAKTKECYEAIYQSEEEFYSLCKKYGIKTFAYDWHYIFDKSKNSIRYQINKDRVLLDSAAMKFHFYPDKLEHFSLLYQNTYYRVYNVNNEKEKPVIAQGLRYLPFFDPRVFVVSDGKNNLNDSFIFDTMTKVWNMPKMLGQANEFRAKGKNSEAESLYKQLIEIDPYFPDTYMTLAGFYLNAGKKVECMKALEAGFKMTGDVKLKEAMGSLSNQK